MNDRFSFSGPWIGETMGCDSPAHIWEISVGSTWLYIQSYWEGELHRSEMVGTPVHGEPAFSIGSHLAVLVDPLHFVIVGWDTNDIRGGMGPDYDVVFSRPGVAELAAHDAYRRFREQYAYAADE